MLLKRCSCEKRQQEKSSIDEDLDKLSTINCQILKLKTEASELHASLRLKKFKVLENVSASLASTRSDISEMKSWMETLFQQNRMLGQMLKSVESEVKGIASDIADLSLAVVAMGKNVAELRNLSERVAEKSDALSEEFVERHIKEPTIEDIGSLYNSIRQVAHDANNGDQSGLLEQARLLLESQGARIIEPEEGTGFNPREHRPVKKVETSSEQFHGKVARVFSSGFGFNGRIIKHAVVEVFVHNKDANKKKKGEQNELKDQ